MPELSITVFCLDRRLRFVKMSRARSQASIQGIDSAWAPISAIVGDDARFLAQEPDLLDRPTKHSAGALAEPIFTWRRLFDNKIAWDDYCPGLLAWGATGTLDSKWPGSERAAARGWCRLVESRDGPADSRPSGSCCRYFMHLPRGAVDWFDWLESTSYLPVPLPVASN